MKSRSKPRFRVVPHTNGELLYHDVKDYRVIYRGFFTWKQIMTMLSYEGHIAGRKSLKRWSIGYIEHAITYKDVVWKTDIAKDLAESVWAYGLAVLDKTQPTGGVYERAVRVITKP